MNQLQLNSYSEWLVVRCQLGETDAFDRLVELWHRRFFLYAMNRLGERAAAQDATQECLLSISRGLGKLSDPAAFPKWSFRILERRCIDSLRKKIREREALHTQQLDAAEDIESSDNIESELTVRQVLAMMDPRLASILRLYYLESLSINEIAEISSLPPGTVKSRLFYARKLLANILNKE